MCDLELKVSSGDFLSRGFRSHWIQTRKCRSGPAEGEGGGEWACEGASEGASDSVSESDCVCADQIKKKLEIVWCVSCFSHMCCVDITTLSAHNTNLYSYIPTATSTPILPFHHQPDECAQYVISHGRPQTPRISAYCLRKSKSQKYKCIYKGTRNYICSIQYTGIILKFAQGINGWTDCSICANMHVLFACDFDDCYMHRL